MFVSLPCAGWLINEFEFCVVFVNFLLSWLFHFFDNRAPERFFSNLHEEVDEKL